MSYRPTPEEFDDIPVSAGSVEPMPKPDHKAKKHGKPRRTEPRRMEPRRSEKLGGGHFVFRRGDHGRITPNGLPFEHTDLQSANDEAYRLATLTGGTFEVYARQGSVAAGEAAILDEDWDRGPVDVTTKGGAV